MRITESQLRRIVREEASRLLETTAPPVEPGPDRALLDADPTAYRIAWERANARKPRVARHDGDRAYHFALDAHRLLKSRSKAVDFIGELIDSGPETACRMYPRAGALCRRTDQALLANANWLEDALSYVWDL